MRPMWMAHAELLRIAREEGVGKVVYTSSVATMGFKGDGTIVDESTPVELADMMGRTSGRSSWRSRRRFRRRVQGSM